MSWNVSKRLSFTHSIQTIFLISNISWFKSIAWLEGILVLTCRSDSKFIIHMIFNGVEDTHLLFPLVDKICSFINRSWALKFQHAFREASHYIDWPAKTGNREDIPLQILLSCPNELQHKVLACKCFWHILFKNKLVLVFSWLFFFLFPIIKKIQTRFQVNKSNSYLLCIGCF